MDASSAQEVTGEGGVCFGKECWRGSGPRASRNFGSVQAKQQQLRRRRRARRCASGAHRPSQAFPPALGRTLHGDMRLPGLSSSSKHTRHWRASSSIFERWRRVRDCNCRYGGRVCERALSPLSTVGLASPNVCSFALATGQRWRVQSYTVTRKSASLPCCLITLLLLLKCSAAGARSPCLVAVREGSAPGNSVHYNDNLN